MNRAASAASTPLPADSQATPMSRESQPTVGNPFLVGAFAPVKEETTTEVLKVRGDLPADLNGLYVRIGPNPMKTPNAKKHHWFTGDGMVHGIAVQGGKAQWYRNRYVGSKTANQALGRPVIPGKARGVFDTVNTNVFAHAGRIWASVEAGPYPIQLDAQLNSVRHGLFNSDLPQGYTAHPHLDPITGDLHAVCYDAMKFRELSYVRVNAKGDVDKLVKIPVKHGPMVHDCAITRTQVVVMDLPVTFSMWSLLKREGFPYAWNRKHPARVGLLPREGDASGMRWYDVDPCYVFHPCNAYDLPDGTVVMDVVVHEHMFDQSRVGPEADTNPTFERWVLPARGNRVQRERICSRPQEFPRLNETLVGQPYRYAYTTEFAVDNSTGQCILKHDLDTGKTTEHQLSRDHKPGEFVFVPREGGKLEDDGWLVGYAHNEATQRGEFHVLDARTMSHQAVVEMPVRIPMGFHGNWVAQEALSQKA
jgi:carotenoid cleavage dioxygenase-like enzyme